MNDDRIRFACPSCNKKHSVSSNGAGREARCQNPECGRPFVIPIPDAEEPPAPTKAAPKNYRGAIVSAAIPLVVIGLGSFLTRPSVKPAAPVIQTAPEKVEPETPEVKVEPDPAIIEQQKRELAAANEKKRQEEKKERAARKQRETLLVEYVTLARIHSSEYYHNNRMVKPAQPDMRVIRPLARSGNAEIRSVAASLVKGQAMIDGFQGNGSPASTIADLAADAPNRGQEYKRGGQRIVTDQQDFRNRAAQAYEAARAIQQRQMAGRSFQATLNEMSADRHRVIYKLAKDLSGPQADNSAVQLKADAFAPGEAAFRVVDGDSMNANYCLTLAAGDTKLTHCFIATVVRRAVRKKDGQIDPPAALGLDEVTAAILEPDKSGLDTTTMFYVGDINPGSLIHILPFRGATAATTGKAGLVLFCDQKTVVCDPMPCFQEVREKYLAARQQQNGAVAQPERRGRR
jgi:hypothetical protein